MKLKDFIESQNKISLNFYTVASVGYLNDYESFSEDILNSEIREITSPMGDYVSWIYLEKLGGSHDK